MFAIDLISSAIPALSPDDRAGRALELMNEFHTDSLPLVTDRNYLGLMEEDRLLEADTAMLLTRIPVSVIKPAIREDVHFFEAVKIAGTYQLSVLPVLDKSGCYAGAIPVHSLLTAVSRFNSIREEGGLLVLEIKSPDYMLSEIARAAEAEEISLLGVHTVTDPDADSLTVLLKTNRQSLDGFVASLRQLNYEVVYRFDKAENTDSLQKNYDHLMNYINM